MPCLRHITWIVLAVILLSACSDTDNAEPTPDSQSYYFTESLKQVESAGRQLQNSSLSAEELRQALSTMDAGIKLAFKVEADFLEKLDPVLAKFYQRFFVEGVQAYRLGIEAGDSEEQKKGLRLLSQWSKFWTDAGLHITEKMQSK